MSSDNSSIPNLLDIIQEMGQKRVNDYIQTFVVAKKTNDPEQFVQAFQAYLESIPCGKDGNRTISTFTFEEFLQRYR